MSGVGTSLGSIYALQFDLQAENDARLPYWTGQYAHALFLNLVKQFDPARSRHLHDIPGSRPFTISLLHGTHVHEGQMQVKKHQTYALRLTLLDGGQLWQQLSLYILDASPIVVTLGNARLRLVRVRSTNNTAHTIGSSTWEQLLQTPFSSSITFHFVSPTVFNVGERQFSLFPHPELVWGSLLRSWNTHAPSTLHLDRASLLSSLQKHSYLVEGKLATATVSFSHARQKGFQGLCQFTLAQEDSSTQALCALAAFAPYAGVGYKTTMGMGQVRVFLKEKEITTAPPVMSPPFKSVSH